MAIFGLSPLFLSFLALRFFASLSSNSLDVASFLQFLAILTFITHILGAFTLQGRPAEPADTLSVDSVEDEVVDERSPLITAKSRAQSSMLVSGDQDGLNHPLHDRYFWFLALYCFATIGAVSKNELYINGPQLRCFDYSLG